MKVSIITPAYNAEKFISRCLEHSLGQSYKDIEVIVVDDGSADKTIDIAQKFAEKDPRLKLLYQDHKGPNMARKKGLDIATGEYVLFVDVDDFLVKNAVAVLVDKIRNLDIDSIRFNAKYRNNDELVLPILGTEEEQRILKHDEIMKILLTTYRLNSLCMQFYKTDSIRRVDAFNSDIVFGEDFLVNLQYHKKTKQMLVIQDALYYYCENPKSTTHNRNIEQLLKNFSDRVFVSCEAIKYGLRCTEKLDVINEINYSQLRMIAETLLAFAKIPGYSKNAFLNDAEKALPRKIFEFIDIGALNIYMRRLKVFERIKNRGLINAMMKSDYNSLWRYLQLAKVRNFIRNHGGER